MNDLFSSITKSEIHNFADDSTLYSCKKNLELVFSNLKYDVKNVLDRFEINYSKTNSGRFQFMILGAEI